MAGEREEDELTEADRQVMRLYEEESKPIDWDESDDAILAFSREIHADKETETAPKAANDEDSTVVAFAPRPKQSFVHQIIHSPAMGFSLAACLMIGVFAGQGVMPYMDLGISPAYDDVVTDNKRLQGELNQVKTQLTRSLKGPGAAPAPDATGSIMQLTQALSGFDCASLSATLSKDLRITVSGYVANDADLQRLSTKLADFGRVADVVNQARVAGWPSCEVLDILHHKASAPADPVALPAIVPFQHGLSYTADEKLVVEAAATTLYDGYLYVDFIQHDGTVLHMLPGPDRTDNAVKAGERVLLGNGAQEYTIAPPYGTEMLVVVSSPTPLFDKDRPQVEKAKDYLGQLKQTLDAAEQRAGGAKVISNYTFITTGQK